MLKIKCKIYFEVSILTSRDVQQKRLKNIIPDDDSEKPLDSNDPEKVFSNFLLKKILNKVSCKKVIR